MTLFTLSSGEATVIAALIVGVVSLATAFLAQRQSRSGAAATAALAQSANELDERKVDLEYFKEYRLSMESRMDNLEDEIKQEREARVRAEERADAADRRAAQAERRAARLERRVGQLEIVLRANHIVVPPYDDDDDLPVGLLPDI